MRIIGETPSFSWNFFRNLPYYIFVDHLAFLLYKPHDMAGFYYFFVLNTSEIARLKVAASIWGNGITILFSLEFPIK